MGLGATVVVIGEDADGVPALALWHVNLQGVATGAWIVPQEQAFGDRAVACRLLSCVTQRAVTGLDQMVAESVLVRLATVAGIQIAGNWWEPLSFSLVAVFRQVLQRRAAYEKSVGGRRAVNKSIVALEWQRDLAIDDLPVDIEALRVVSRLAMPAGAPVVRDVLLVCRLLGWLVELWSETEQAKNRRSYLQDEHGAPEALPPAWLTALSAAGSARLPL
jgi:Family of unknown function (DUF6218)